MNITFAEDVPQNARQSLEWFLRRAYKVGIFCKSMHTRKPGFDRSERTVEEDDKIVYLFDEDEKGDIHVSVSQEH